MGSCHCRGSVCCCSEHLPPLVFGSLLCLLSVGFFWTNNSCNRLLGVLGVSDAKAGWWLLGMVGAQVRAVFCSLYEDRKTTFSLQDGLRPREVLSPDQAKAMVHLLQRITHQVQDLALEVFPETTETKELGAHWGSDGRAAWNLCARWATNRQPPMELRWAQTSSPLSVFRGGNDVVLGLSRCSACITNPRQVQWTTAGVRMPNARV
ncbi:hypothetical protein Ancab_032478 [Ancistrocladus abbreviatus]